MTHQDCLSPFDAVSSLIVSSVDPENRRKTAAFGCKTAEAVRFLGVLALAPRLAYASRKSLLTK